MMNVYSLNTKSGIVYYETTRAIIIVLCYIVILKYILRGGELPEMFVKKSIAFICSIVCYHLLFDHRVSVHVVSEKNHDSILA